MCLPIQQENLGFSITEHSSGMGQSPSNQISSAAQLVLGTTSEQAIPSQSFTNQAPRMELYTKLYGFVLARAIYVAAEMGIADWVHANSAPTLFGLSKAMEVPPEMLVRLMRLLCCNGIFRIDADGKIFSTKLSMELCTDGAGSLKGTIIQDHRREWDIYESLTLENIPVDFEFRESEGQAGGLGLWRMATGYKLSRAIYLAAEMRIAEHIRNGTNTIDKLSQEVRPGRTVLSSLMSLLVNAGIFMKTPKGEFVLTTRSSLLLSDEQGTVRDVVLLEDSMRWRALTHLRDALKEGKAVFGKIAGCNYFDYLKKTPKLSALFDSAMTQLSLDEIQVLMAHLDLHEHKVIVDIGGGQGKFLAALLKKNTSLKGVLFDLPGVVQSEQCHQSLTEVRDRSEVVGGSFFDGVPKGDVFLLKRVIHDWGDREAIKILTNCRESLNPGGRVILNEIVLPFEFSMGNESHLNSFLCSLDVYLSVLFSGKERTLPEMEDLLRQAGLKMVSLKSTSTYLSIIEAKSATG